VDIVELVSETVKLRRAGRNWVGLCPFHEEKTPSFNVTPDRGLFYCHGCHASGDVFTYLMRREGCDFPEAVERLAARAGVRLPERRGPNPRLQSQRDRLARVLDDASAFFREHLPAAAAYLSRRGVSEETARRFGLGFAPPEWDALLRALTRRGHEPQTLAEAGLVAARPAGDGYYDRFRGRLMFPIHDERGALVAFGGRALGEDHPKYLNSPETPLFSKRRTWYGLHLAREAIRREGRAIVTEGYMDVVTAHQHGFTAAVASLGTSLSAEQAGALARHAEEVFIAYDADSAGQAATWRGLGILQETDLRVRVVSLPAGRDPDELLRREGAEAFRTALESALPLVEYVAKRAASGRNLARIDERLAAAGEVAPFVARCRGPEREHYAELAARRLLLDPHAFAPIWGRMVEKGEGYKGGGRRDNTKDLARSIPHGPASAALKAQEGLLALMAAEGSHLRRIGERAAAGDFEPGPRRSLFEALRSLDEPAEGRAPGLRVLEAAADPEVRALLGRLMMQPVPAEDPVQAREGWLDFLERRRRQGRADEIRARLVRGDPVPAADLDEYQRLLAADKVPGQQRSYGDG
jgi:DNA primase